ncbi:MAG TPA: hypothetical protein VLT62_27225 [Candidatus Methylomirabilis sp.]|nr:hypothetical protein [Candidatus Methylomirabilis sp.]
MLAGLARLIRQSAAGIRVAIRARPRVFVAVTIGVFLLDLCLPPLVLSVARKPVDYFTFNPWLTRLPEYLVSNQAAIGEKLASLLRVALFWVSADSPYGGVEWGYAVDASDLIRFFFTSLVVGAYFALWLARRDRLSGCEWGARMGRRSGILGALTSVLGLSTGPCSVMGCGAPVIPVLGLAFIGLSSGTLTLLSELSKVGTSLVLTALTLAVAYLGWLVSVKPPIGQPTRST